MFYKQVQSLIIAVLVMVVMFFLNSNIVSFASTPTESTLYYSHEKQLNLEVIRIIDEANTFVYFAVYSFTRNDIRDALIRAKKRGLVVRGIMDREQLERLKNQQEVFKGLTEAGIPVATQDHSALMHIKAVVTENAFASGSFNWTSNATNLNDEFLELGKEEKLRKQYEEVLLRVLDKYSK